MAKDAFDFMKTPLEKPLTVQEAARILGMAGQKARKAPAKPPAPAAKPTAKIAPKAAAKPVVKAKTPPSPAAKPKGKK